MRFIPDTRTFRFELADDTLVNQLPAVDLDKADLIGYLPIEAAVSVVFQMPLPLEGV